MLPAGAARPQVPSNGLNVPNPPNSALALMALAAKSQKKMWDAGSLLQDSQKEALSTLAEYVAVRPLPVEAWREDTSPAIEYAQRTPVQTKGDEPASPGVTCTVSDLYRSLAEAEAAGSEEELVDVIDQQRRLKGMLALCDTILEKLALVEVSLVSLQDQHDSVVSKTSAVHTECEKLTAEKTELEGLAKAIQNRLAHYDELESLQRQLMLPTMQVASPPFLPLLTKIDEAIAHLATNAHFENTAVYLGRFRQLQARALAMVKAHVNTTLTAATERVNAVLKETSGASGGAPSSQDAAAAGGGVQRVEGALIAYVQYQAVAEGIKALMMEMARRAARTWEYGELLDECQEIYFRQRQAILHGPTVAKLHAALALASLGEGLRVGCAELCDLCHREHKLLQHFFPPLERGGLPILLNPLCTELVDTVRPMFLKIVDVEELCSLALILKGEILEDRIEIRGESLAPMRACVSGLLNEVQERLTFRAQVFIRDEIQGYSPSKDELDYPARLQRAGGDKRSTAAATGTDERDGDEYGEWCPVLPRTLSFLSQLYRTVDTKIFEGLAQDAVLACTECLISCSKTLTRNKGPADGGLFLVMHLLKLREQIVPFDVDFSSTELNLDFSDTRSALASLISSRRSLFSWSANNALLSLAKAPPRVYHTLRNAKKDLERELKHACESFILLAASQVAEPFVSWVRKADALIPAGAAAGRVSAIREHAFAQPDKVKELMGHLKRAVGAFNSETVSKMGQYLANPQTRSVLLTPIRNNIVDAYARMHTYLLAEYQPEEYIAMAVLAPEELTAALGGHQVVLLSASSPSTPFASDDSAPHEPVVWGQTGRPSLGAATDLKLSAGGGSPESHASHRPVPPQHSQAADHGSAKGTRQPANQRSGVEGQSEQVAPVDGAERKAPDTASASQERERVAEQGIGETAETEARQAAAREQKERAERDSAAREQVEREAREAAAREKAERDGIQAAAREKAQQQAMEAAAKEAEEREARETASRDKAELEAQEAREKADKEAREAAALEKAEHDAREAARESAERAARDAAAREKALREESEAAAREKAQREAMDAAAREKAEVEAAARAKAQREAIEAAAREKAEVEASAREKAQREAMEAAAREQAEVEAAAREKAEREARQVAAREQAEREAAAREKTQREAKERAANEAARAAESAPGWGASEDEANGDGDGDEYGSWIGYGQDNGGPEPDHHETPAPSTRPAADAHAGPDRPDAADGSSLSAGGVPAAAAGGVAVRPLAALHRGARPLAGLHRGSKGAAPAAAAGPNTAVGGGTAFNGGGGGSGNDGGEQGADAAAQSRAAQPPAASGVKGIVPIAAGGGSRLMASSKAAPSQPTAAPVFGGGKLPPGFQLVDGELKYVGR